MSGATRRTCEALEPRLLFASVVGALWNDADASGDLGMGEYGMNGWTVYADDNWNGQPSPGERSTTTAADGTWALSGLPTDDPSLPIRAVLQPHSWQSAPSGGGQMPGLSEYNLTASGLDFGMVLGRDGSVSGNVFHDVNRNAARDDGTAGMAGWQVYSDENMNGCFDGSEPATLTDGNGDYTLTGLAFYSCNPIRVTPQAEYSQTFPIYNGNPTIYLYPSEPTATGIDFGYESVNVGVDVIDGQASETDEDPATFRITRLGGTQLASLTVHFALNGTAIPGESGGSAGHTPSNADYLVSGATRGAGNTYTVDFALGESTKDIVLVPIDDNIPEPRMTAILDILYATGFGYGPMLPANVEGGGSATATIYSGDVQLVNWEGYDPGDGKTNFEPGGNPTAQGGEDRFFAERNQPQGRAGDQLHDKIHVRATVDAAPNTGEIGRVSFRVFDPDHYSPDVAFDPRDDPTTYNDNIAAGGAFVIGARVTNDLFTPEVNAVSLTLGQDSVRVGLQIDARQPTNNFIVAAASSQSYVDGITFNSFGTMLMEYGSEGSQVPAGNHSTTVTIWRTLYTEIDSMAGPTSAGLEAGDAPDRVASGSITGVAVDDGDATNITTALSLDVSLGGKEHQFEEGTIRVLDQNDVLLGNYKIRSNSVGANAVVTVEGRVSAAARKFSDLIDDDTAHGVTAADMIPDSSLAASKYEPACVRVITDKKDLSSSNANDTFSLVPFRSHISSSSNEGTYRTNVRATVQANRQSAVTDDFWTVYVLGAYQGSLIDDNDPFMVEWSSGITQLPNPNTTAESIGVILFRETVRDVVISKNVGVRLRNHLKS